ncbi:hypothetical protein [Rathayibacter sp. VKM Ac-2760]|uniref:hypothetical protein n=1 Tax=Rathayibacter sp. VKM Ac-2760 TaxID=2609253 RepID=UPI0013190954|nr:hypothetical protein [Rathayibacter sp. VKM Ac-2760]QHC59120.1 hypothetical protein GSU72_11550 [Rathayibacter sp. VKM Ac-2760]
MPFPTVPFRSVPFPSVPSSPSRAARLRRSAVGLVLLAALAAGAAPAVQAEPSPPSTPTASRPSSATPPPATPPRAVVEHPGLHIAVTARFTRAASGLIEPGSPITLTYHFANTGDVALHDIGPTHEELEPAESSSFSTAERRITAHELDAGVVTVSGTWTARTPTRSWQSRPFATFFFTR